MNILIQKAVDHWEAIPARSGLVTGVGQTPAEALGTVMLSNPEHFGIDAVRFDLTHPMTRMEVERLDLPRTLASRTGIPVPFVFQR